MSAHSPRQARARRGGGPCQPRSAHQDLAGQTLALTPARTVRNRVRPVRAARLWHATAAHVNKTGVFRGLAGPDRRPVKLTGLSRSPCSDPCPAGQASRARVPHGGGCRGPLTAPRAPGGRTPCTAVRPQPTGVRGHCRACGWGTLVSLSGTLATEPHIRGSEEN